MKRWNFEVRLLDGEVVPMVIRGETEGAARVSVANYKGVRAIVSCSERIVERTFPVPPSIMDKPIPLKKSKRAKLYA